MTTIQDVSQLEMFSQSRCKQTWGFCIDAGLADGYFVLPYTMGITIPDIKNGSLSTDSPEFEAAEKELRPNPEFMNNGTHSVDYFHRIRKSYVG
jgi:succinate dehydrogenase / fumarate reductase flavoprotein subunit